MSYIWPKTVLLMFNGLIFWRTPIIDQTKVIFGMIWNQELCIHYLELQTASNLVSWNSIKSILILLVEELKDSLFDRLDLRNKIWHKSNNWNHP